MKSFVIATLLVSSAFAASAMSGNGELYGYDKETFVSTKSRAEVIAELHQAQIAGTVYYGDADIKRGERAAAPASVLTRAEVRMEVAELAAQGLLDHNNNSIYRN